MKRETFIQVISAIKKQNKEDNKIANKLADVYKGSCHENLLPDNHILNNALMMVIQEAMNDTEIAADGHSWIEWYCFETDFGAKCAEFPAYSNGKLIPLNNTGELYDFLKSKITINQRGEFTQVSRCPECNSGISDKYKHEEYAICSKCGFTGKIGVKLDNTTVRDNTHILKP